MSTANSDFMQITLPELFPWVVLTTGAISFQCLVVGFLAGGKRSKLFDHDKIKDAYGEEHQKIFKKDPPKGGYPDHGDGLYGDMLSYSDWFSFSLDQSEVWRLTSCTGVKQEAPEH